MILPAKRWDWLGCKFLRSSFFPPFIQNGAYVFFFPSQRGPYTRRHEFSDMMDSGLATSLASSVRIHRCISSGLRDLCTSKSLDGLKPISYSGQFFIFPSSAFTLCTLGSVDEAFAGEDLGKNVTEYLSILHMLGNQVPPSLLERPHIFLSLPFIINVAIKTFLTAFGIPGQI